MTDRTARGRPRDERRWTSAALVAMAALATWDRLSTEQFHAPVGSVVVGPMIGAIACRPARVAAIAAAAAVVRFVLDRTNDDVGSGQSWFNVGMVLLLSAVAIVASIVRHGNERELAAARPARQLTEFSASLAAARSVAEVQEAFATMARGLLGATDVRFVADDEGGEVATGATSDAAPAYVASLVVASSSLGHVEIAFDSPPSADEVTLLDQAASQVAIALGRAESARALAVTARRLAALQRSTSQLAGLLRTTDIAASMAVEARHAFQAECVLLHVVDGDVVRVAAADGVLSGGHEDLALSAESPVTHAIRTGEIVVHEGAVAAGRGGRAHADGGSEESSVVAPIPGRDGVAAALHIAFDRSHHIDDEERRLLSSLTTLIGTAWRRAERFEQEERERTQSAHRAERAARLAAFTATLADARDRAAVAAAVADRGLAAVDATWGAVFEVDSTHRVLRVLSARSSSSRWAEGATVPLDARVALTEVLQTGRAVVLATRAEILERDTGETVHPDQHARAAVPLVVYGEVVGVLGLAWDQPHTFDDGEMEFLQTLAIRTSEALERARLHESEREDERRWNLLASASARLADALEPGDVVSALVEWAVPLIADSCTVYLAQPDGTARPFVSVDLPEVVAAANVFGRERVDLGSDHPVARLYRLQRTIVLEDLPTTTVDEAVGHDPARIELTRTLGIRHVLAAPLVARNQQLGVLLLTMGRSERHFVDADVELVSDLAARFSIIYDNAVLYATERNITARLQSALLPASITPPNGLDVAVRYLASGSRAGGDWYDLVSFGNSSAALVVGDLVGHGVEAAATMSRYRSALRAHARLFEHADEVMNAFSAFILRDEDGQTATVLYGRIEMDHTTGTQTLSYCSAGHPPPIVLHDGRSTVLPSPQGPLIGLVSGGYGSHTVPLPEGAVVVLYTDGLLERRGETLDVGTRRLEDAMRSIPVDDLERFADDLVAAMAHDQHDDDIALLVARVRNQCENLA